MRRDTSSYIMLRINRLAPSTAYLPFTLSVMRAMSSCQQHTPQPHYSYMCLNPTTRVLSKDCPA